MNLIVNVVVLGLACTMVVGKDVIVGGFVPVGPEDTDTVNKGRNKIIADLESQESSADKGYKAKVVLFDETDEKQLVNGMNYRFKFSAIILYECKDESHCDPKHDQIKTCSATLHTNFDASERFTYINPGLTCEP